MKNSCCSLPSDQLEAQKAGKPNNRVIAVQKRKLTFGRGRSDLDHTTHKLIGAPHFFLLLILFTRLCLQTLIFSALSKPRPDSKVRMLDACVQRWLLLHCLSYHASKKAQRRGVKTVSFTPLDLGISFLESNHKNGLIEELQEVSKYLEVGILEGGERFGFRCWNSFPSSCRLSSSLPRTLLQLWESLQINLQQSSCSQPESLQSCKSHEAALK